jgi:CHAT domain-containing protein/tetratricopeptide (TPR) repeat protein
MVDGGEIPCPCTVREALSGSLIPDELKGDFARAGEIARRSVAAADGSGDLGETDARLDVALVQILQGFPVAALEGLDRLARRGTLTPDRLTRCLALRNLAVHLRFNTFPGGEGAGGAHLATLWDGPAYGTEEVARWRDVPLVECDPAVVLETRLVHDTLCNLKSARAFIVPRPWVSEAGREEYFRTAMQVPVELVQQCRAHQPSDPVAAFGLFAAADLCRRAREPAAMQSFLDEARCRYEGLGDWAGVAICWMLLGDVLAAPFTTPLYGNLPVEDVCDFSSAISEELLELARIAPKAQVDAARAAYEQARTLFERSMARRGLASIKLRQAYLEDLASNSQSAVTAAHRAAECFVSAADHLNAHLARIHDLLYRIHRNPFEWDAVTVREIGEWGRNEGSVSWALGLGLLLTATGRNWLQEHGDGERSITCYRHAQALYEALGAEVNVAQSVVDRAEVHRLSSETDACLSLSLQALDKYLDCRDRLSAIRPDLQNRLIRLLEALYWLHAGAIDPDGMERAAARLRKCLEERSGSDVPAEGQDAPMPDAGPVILTQARCALRQSVVMVPLYRGKTLAEQGLVEEARPHFQRALQAAADLQGPDRDWLEALVLGTMHDFAAAAKVLERRFERGAPPVDDTVAMALRIVGGASVVAVRQMESRLEIAEQLNAFYFLVQMEAFDAAARHLKLVEERAGSDWWRSESRPWESLVRRAELRYGLDDDDGAIEDVDRCIEVLEASRTQLLRDTQRTALGSSPVARRVYTVGIRSAHRLMQRKAHARGQWLERAYKYAEAGKARALLDLLASVGTGRAGHAQPSWIRTWRELNARVTTLRALIADAQARETPHEARLRDLVTRERDVEERLQALTDTVAVDNPRFATMLKARSDVSSMTDVVQYLPNDSLLLQYHFADNEFFGWAMDRSGRVDLHRAGHDAREIGREIRAFHAACSAGGEWTTVGQRLSRVFLAPFTDRLERFEHVVVVPAGHAHRLPFHALPWAGGVLGDTHTVSVLPSGSVLRHLKRPERAEPGPVLAVGDPAHMAWPSVPGARARTLPALPAAALEARYVASLHQGSRALVADEATMTKVRMAIPGYRLLHFATHGVLNERAPLSSAILLANGEALTAADFLGIGLEADLVVLSGCRTGIGDVTAGDEVVGLTRALLASGAKAALVSLWPVLDAATSYFMRHFYEQLGDVGPAGALQRAQAFLRKLTAEQHEDERDRLLTAVKDKQPPADWGDATRDLLAAEAVSREVDYSHPYYWAPFIYVGAA